MRPSRYVLIIDDDPGVADILREVLEERYSVRSCGTVSDTLRLIDDDPPDLILSDCLLPGGSVTRVLRQAEALHRPVVLMSGNVELLEKLAVWGCHRLEKPFRLAELMDVIECSFPTVTRTGTRFW